VKSVVHKVALQQAGALSKGAVGGCQFADYPNRNFKETPSFRERCFQNLHYLLFSRKQSLKSTDDL